VVVTDFNPLAGALMGGAQAQQQVDVEKQRQLRRAQALRKNVALQDDQLEHQVESSEEISPVHDESEGKSGGGDKHPGHPPKHPDNSHPHVDVKA
jgi:hypothetical protein